MSDSGDAVKLWTVFHFISQPEHPVKLRGNFLELLTRVMCGCSHWAEILSFSSTLLMCPMRR